MDEVMSFRKCPDCCHTMNLNFDTGIAYCGHCNHEERFMPMRPPRTTKKATITLKDGNNDIRIDTAIRAGDIDAFFGRLRDALSPYYREGVKIVSIYFWEESDGKD